MPIKVGIIGLSTKPSAWATLAHFPYLRHSPHYTVVAVCNSSQESSERAISHFQLPASTRAYSSYEALASDPEIELYVVSTRADTHFDVSRPALSHPGSNVKAIYVEWPLAENAAVAGRMADLAREAGIRTIVGFQGRASPSVLKVKEIVASGRLGAVHSVNYQGATNVWQDNAAGERYRYFLDRRVGGNLLTIYGGHVLDSILFAVGELVEGSVTTMSGNFRKKMRVRRDDGTYEDGEFDKDTPDQMMLLGRIDRGDAIAPAMFSFHLRAGERFLSHPGSIWRVYGTKGELQMAFTSAGPQIGTAQFIKISNYEDGVVEDVEIREGDCIGGDGQNKTEVKWADLPTQGQNIGRLYEAFATGGEYADWDTAVKRHELVDSFYEGML